MGDNREEIGVQWDNMGVLGSNGVEWRQEIWGVIEGKLGYSGVILGGIGGVMG